MSENSGLSGLRINRTAVPNQAIPRPPGKWLTRRVVPISLVIIALALLAYAARDNLRPAVPVRTLRAIGKTVQGRTGSVTVQAPGWVEADPYPIHVPALAPGVVKEILVLEGEPVRAGQIVARLIDDDALLALDQARARLANQQAQLTAAQSNWDHPIDLDRRVAVTEASLQQVQAERAQLASEIAMHEARLAELEDRHRRIAALGPDSAAEQQVIQSGLQRDAQRALLEATQKKQDVLTARHAAAAAEAEAAREQRELRIEQRRVLDQARAEVQLAEAMVAEAALRLDRMAVRSPASGIVMTRLAVPGSKLMLAMDEKLSANAVHLYDPNRLQVRVDVPLADAAQVGIGQRAEITVDVLPDTRFAGQVTRIVHEADIQKNTLEVKVAIRHPTAQLKPEMLARVKFMSRESANRANTATQAVFVPERLLQQRSGETARVWLMTPAGTATCREITLGRQQQEGWIETVSGLNPGDTLIADATKELHEGQSVRTIGEAAP
jgi:RND family efflux transporter MFP subunit